MRTEGKGERQTKKKYVLFDVVFSFPCAVTMTIEHQLAQAFRLQPLCVCVPQFISCTLLVQETFYFSRGLFMLLCLACVQKICYFEAHLRAKNNLCYLIKFSLTLKAFLYYDNQNK